MSELLNHLQTINENNFSEKAEVVADIQKSLEAAGYEIVELDDARPWGGFFRMNGNQAERFIDEFFPGLTLAEAQLGIDDAELSPKILLVQPSQRLSWQYHDRRAERWIFLTEGGYHKSMTDDEGDLKIAQPGEWVQFERGERHRLTGVDSGWTVVAEIWQHTDRDNLSNEQDIVRLADDYKR